MKAGVGWRRKTKRGDEFGIDGVIFASTAAASPFSKAGNDPVEILMAGTYGLPGEWITIFAGGALGLHEGYGTADWRAFLGTRVNIGSRDGDHDGLPDNVDRCPAAAEDRDAFEDGDGCPDVDDDDDGVPDTQDRCPTGAGAAATGGCPGGSPGIELLSLEGEACVDIGEAGHRGTCALRGRIVFAPHKAELPPGVSNVLEEIAAALKRGPASTRLRIYGYADEEANTAANLALSGARAESLQSALRERGVPADRLQARGLGAVPRSGRGIAGHIVEFVMSR
jgi:outer membrane protein OmpA-like peptidoglycan-associated protein